MVKQGDVISVMATGTTNYSADKSHGPWDADGFSDKPIDEQGVMANVLALLIRINGKTFVAGKNLSDWTVPETGEIIFLVNDRKNQYGDNSGELSVTVVQGKEDMGNNKPLPIPGLLKKTQFTVTLINNEDWVRTATLNIDGKDQTLEVAGHTAISKAFTTETGVVTIALVDSQKGAMRVPSDINVLRMGVTGKTMGFGAEKPSDEVRPAFMDVFVHIDWDTLINN